MTPRFSCGALSFSISDLELLRLGRGRPLPFLHAGPIRSECAEPPLTGLL
jgi:hypothetical protein